MAAYEPIRDSFREFNRMLTDSQSWNARHASSTADRELKQTMLLNQLEQQKFTNEMSERAMVISEAGNRRDAERLQENIARNARLDASTAAQLKVTNALNNRKLNQQINKAGAEDSDRDAARAIQADLAKGTLAKYQDDLKTSEQQRNILKQQEAEAVNNTIPKPAIVPNWDKIDEVTQEEYKDKLYSSGQLINEEGRITDLNGNEIKTPGWRQQEELIKLDAIVIKNSDRPTMAKNEKSVLQNQVKNIQSTLNKNKKTTYNVDKIASLVREKHKLEGAIRAKDDFLKRASTPIGQVKELRFRANQLLKAAGRVENIGGTRAKAVAEDHRKHAKSLNDQATVMEAAIDEQNTKATSATEQKLISSTAITTGEKLLKDRVVGQKTMMDQFSELDTDKASTASGIYAEKIAEFTEKNGTQPKTAGQVQVVREKAYSEMVKIHNALYNEYKKAKVGKTEEEFQTWVDGEYARKIEAVGFYYSPTKPFRKQK